MTFEQLQQIMEGYEGSSIRVPAEFLKHLVRLDRACEMLFCDFSMSNKWASLPDSRKLDASDFDAMLSPLRTIWEQKGNLTNE